MTSTTDLTSPSNTAPQVAVNYIGSAEDILAAVEQTIKPFNDGDLVSGTVVKVDRDEVLAVSGEVELIRIGETERMPRESRCETR